VTQTEDRSYYEISLTNGQVLAAFSVLLACVLGAFVSGMWVAREALGDAPPASASAGPDVEGEPSETIEFFGGGAESAPGAAGQQPGQLAPASQSAGGPPRAQIQQVKPLPRGDEKVPAGPVVISGPSPATASADEDRRESVPAAGVDTDRREPVPAAGADTDRREPAPAPSPATAATQAPAGAAVERGFVIQVFSSNDEAQANALLQRLRSRDYTAFRTAEPVGGRTMYRVRVGPYPDRSTADREAEKLKREFKLDTWVTASG
jgi:cell division septation protein DedD